MGAKPNNVVQQAKSTGGICRVCLCTDEAACAEGCEWTDKAHTLCSACKDLTASEAVEKRVAAVKDLQLQCGMLRVELINLRDSLADVRQRLKFAARNPIENPKSKIQN